MGDGAGSSSIVVLHWCHLVVMCHCRRLLVIACCGSLIALCPGHGVIRCYRRHAPSSPCCPLSSLCLAVRSCPSHIIIVLVAWLHHVSGSPQLNIACVCSSLSWVSAKWVGMNARQGVLTMVVKITAMTNNNQCHHLLFGCHITDCDVAPGFHIKELISEEG